MQFAYREDPPSFFQSLQHPHQTNYSSEKILGLPHVQDLDEKENKKPPSSLHFISSHGRDQKRVRTKDLLNMPLASAPSEKSFLNCTHQSLLNDTNKLLNMTSEQCFDSALSKKSFMQFVATDNQGRSQSSQQKQSFQDQQWQMQPSSFMERQSIDVSTVPIQVSYVDTSYKSELPSFKSREAQKNNDMSYAQTSNEKNNFQSKRTSLAQIDKSIQYLKSQLDYPVEHAIRLNNEEGCLYDIIPTKQPNNHRSLDRTNSSIYSFSKLAPDRSKTLLNKESQQLIKPSCQESSQQQYTEINYFTQPRYETKNDILIRDQSIPSYQHTIQQSLSKTEIIARQDKVNSFQAQSTKNVNLTMNQMQFGFSPIGKHQKVSQSFGLNNSTQLSKILARPADISAMSMLSQTFSLEDDYKLLLKSLKAWQKAISLIKLKRNEKKQYLRNMAAAIHFNEQSLCSKVILSFIKARIIKQQHHLKQAKVKTLVKCNIKRFYFHSMLKKYKQHLWLKSGATVASLQYKKHLRVRVFSAFKSQVKCSVSNKTKMFNKIIRSPASLYYLLRLVAAITSKRGMDLFKLHHQSMTDKRVVGSSNQRAFSRAIESALTYQMQTIFHSWKKHVAQIITFKSKLLTRLIKKAFKHFVHIRSTKQKVSKSILAQQSKLKFKALLSLRQYADFYLLLRKKHQVAFKRHSKRVYSRYLGAWTSLFAQYQQLMKESICKIRQSNNNFLRKYFIAMRTFSRRLKCQRAKRTQAMLHFYDKWLRLCFKGWSSYSQKSSLQNKAKRRVVTKRKIMVKSHYLTQWIRSCFLNEMQRRYRKTSLLRKGFATLVNLITLKRIQQQIDMISSSHYHKQLQSKVIRGIHSKLSQKKQLSNIVKTVRRQRDLLWVRKLFSGMTQQVQAIRVSKELRRQASLAREVSVMKKGFARLRQGCHKMMRLRSSHMMLKDFTQKRRLYSIVRMLYFKHARKQHLRFLSRQFKERQCLSLKHKSFYFLFNKWRQLQIIGGFLLHRTCIRLQGEVFEHWYESVCQINNYKMKYMRILAQRNRYLQQQIIKTLMERVKFRRLRDFAIALFFRNYLKRIIAGFRLNAQILREKRQVMLNLQVVRKRTIFQGFVKAAQKSINKMKVYQLLVATIEKRAFVKLQIYSMKQRDLKIKFISLMVAHQHLLKATVMKVLKMNFEVKGLGYEDVYNHMQMRQISLVVDSLRVYAKRRRVESLKELKIFTNVSQRILANALSAWQVEYHIHNAYNTKCMPYIIAKDQQIKALVFQAIKEKYQQAKLHQRNFSLLQSGMQRRLMNDAFARLKGFSLRKNHQRKCFNQLQLTKSFELKLISLKSLWTHRSKMQCVRMKHLKVMKNYQLNLKSFTLETWISKYNKWVKVKSLIDQAHQLHSYILAKRVLSSFKKYRVVRIQKINMYEGVDMFRNGQMKLQTYKVWRRIFQARMHDRRKQLFKLKCENLNYKRGLMLKHTALDALKTLLKNRETRLLAMEAMFETVERKLLHLSLKEIRTHALIRIRLDGKQDEKDKRLKTKTLFAMRRFYNRRQVRYSQKVQAKAQSSLGLLRKGFRGLQQYLEYKEIKERLENKAADFYLKQLTQKAFMTLQWHTKREKYLQNLVLRSDNFNNLRLKQSLFDLFKDKLILKYKGIQLQQRTEYLAMASCFQLWLDLHQRQPHHGGDGNILIRGYEIDEGGVARVSVRSDDAQ